MSGPGPHFEASPTATSTEPSRPSHQRGIAALQRRHERRRHLFPRALLVGLLAGIVAVLFRLVLERVEGLRSDLVATMRPHGVLGAIPVVAVVVLLVVGAVWITRRFAPEASGSGIPHLHAVLHRLHPLHWRRLLPVKFAGGVMGIAGGLALGREGPTVQMGGAIGEMVGRWLGATSRERQVLLCAGAGAGLSAAFNAPLAGLIFVLEELRRDFAPGVFSTTFVSSVVAGTLTRLVLGQHPVFRIGLIPTPPLAALPLFIGLGVVAGLVGVCFSRTLLGALALAGRRALAGRWWPVVLVAIAAGITAYLLPGTVGGGATMVEQTLAGAIPLTTLGGLFVLRLLMTTGSYATGAPGGIFAPLLVLGAQTGLAVSIVVGWLLPHAGVSPTAFAVVGMAALFAGVVRAPLTGVVLILEMTESYALMLALLAASLSAWGIAELLGEKPIYEALLERGAGAGEQRRAVLDEALLVDLVVAAGSAFEGARVAELGLPPGVLLVDLRRGLRSEVPRRDTRLRAGDRLTAVVSPEAPEGLGLLERGVSGP